VTDQPDAPEPADFAYFALRRQQAAAAESRLRTDEAVEGAQVIAQLIAHHGGNMRDPGGAAMAVAVTGLLEQWLYTGMTIRLGDKTRGIGPTPDDGIDHTGAMFIMDVIRDLRDAAAILRDADSPSAR